MPNKRVEKLRRYFKRRYKLLEGVEMNDLITYVSSECYDYRCKPPKKIRFIEYCRVSGMGFSWNNIKINPLTIKNQQKIIAIYKPKGKGFVRYAHRKGIYWVKDKSYKK